jgi:uncharacterized protein YukE
MTLDPSVPAEQEIQPDLTYQLHLDMDSDLAQQVQPGTAPVPDPSQPVLLDVAVRPDPALHIPAQELLVGESSTVPGGAHSHPKSDHGSSDHGHPKSDHGSSSDHGHPKSDHGSSSDHGHPKSDHGSAKDHGSHPKKTPQGGKKGDDPSGGGMSIADFKVNLADLKAATEIVSDKAKAIRQLSHMITERLQGVERAWISPAGGTFTELQIAATADMEMLNSVLDEMVRKMNIAHDNYELAEQNNTHNVS